MKKWFIASAALVAVSVGFAALAAEAPKPAKPAAPKDSADIPHGQKAPVGPALSPDEAIAKMVLPPGFKIECVASEPLLINPTSFTFDGRGRIWVTESVEYPRKPSGKGQDRVKILEDTNGDGVYDKATIFKDGLNIPCGIAIGNGGVYITNSPDILFLQDTDGDGKADKEEVILTGFGRDDTHELPNSLTWGPDGWLYGMNGVFNQSKVRNPAWGEVYSFTCAIWRYHPPTHRFELFSEGTSNPWGVDYNRDGEWFISCCVIDHLFHMTQSAYYHRQGGAYPPNVQQAKLPSITTERHQAAAYAGLCIYDADAFPEEYRGRLIMGNLHGSALNQDVLTRRASTYVQKNVKGPNDNPLSDGVGSLDFAHANDAWFMPVSQKIGPDGCLYVMDWYDRYHCYQDANRDAPGIDRLKGRIYRISYNGTPRAKPFDLDRLSPTELVSLLEHPNVWWRREAARRIIELPKLADHRELLDRLKTMALDPAQKNNANRQALWILVAQNALDESFLLKVLDHADETTRNWGVRAVGNEQRVTPTVYEKLKLMAAGDPSPGVRVQTAVTAGRLPANQSLPLLLTLLKDAANGKDPLIPHVVFMNLRPLVADHGAEILAGLSVIPNVEQSFGETTVRWVKQAIASSGKGADSIVAEVLKNLQTSPEPKKAVQALETMIDGLAHLPIDERAKAVNKELRDRVLKYTHSEETSVRTAATTIALWWRDAQAVESARKIVADPSASIESRLSLARTLAESRVIGNNEAFTALAGDKNVPIRLRQVAIDALGVVNRTESARAILGLYPTLPAEMKPAAINTLVRTFIGANALLDALEKKQIAASDITANHARSIAALNDKPLTDRLTKAWGSVKTDRDPERVKIVEKMRKVVEAGKGEPHAGWKVFETRCAQCHTIYGKGGQVGPDLTGVGRDDLTAILTSVLDPNLVIGAPYYVNVVKTKDGDVVSGLLVEQSETQIVLKDQTKQTIIPRSNVEKHTVQNVSMMPEGLEQQMTDQDFRDLVSFLLTREPPK